MAKAVRVLVVAAVAVSWASAQQAVDGFSPSTDQQEMMQSAYGSPAFSPAPPQDKWAYMPRPLAYMKFNNNLDNSGTYAEVTIHPQSWAPPYCENTDGVPASGGACYDFVGPWPLPAPTFAAVVPPSYVNGSIGCEYTLDTSRASASRCRQALSNSMVKLNRNPNAGRKEGSWTFWIRAAAGTNAGTIFHRSRAIKIWATAAAGSTNINVQLNEVAAVAATAALSPNEWTHIGVTWNGVTGHLKIYRNSVEVHASNGATLQVAMNDDSFNSAGATFYPTLGGDATGDTASPTNKWPGEIDDFAIWPKALTAVQVDSVYKCGVDTSEVGTAVRAMGGGHPMNTLVPHTGLTLASYGYALCATTSETIANQGGWWPHSTTSQTHGDGGYTAQDTDWQGPFPHQSQGHSYLSTPYMKYRNVVHPHQGALHQHRSRALAVGANSPHVATGTTGDWQITTGLNGEQASWPYSMGADGVDRSTISSYHSATVHTKDDSHMADHRNVGQSGAAYGRYLGFPGNGNAQHCDLHNPGGAGPPCSSHSVIGLEHSDPAVTQYSGSGYYTGGVYGYTTWSGGAQADDDTFPMGEVSYAQAPVEGENGYMPTHTPHPTRQPEFYPTFGNHENGDSGEVGHNEYPMAHLTDCMMHMSGSLGLNTGTCFQPGYKLANGLHPGTYLGATN